MPFDMSPTANNLDLAAILPMRSPADLARIFTVPEIDAETGRRGDWVATFLSGCGFFPYDPCPEEVFLEDIAHALSQQCRYGGAVRRHYSIAEHGYLISCVVEQVHPDRPDLAMGGLHHDDEEAYLIDWPRPIKLHLPMYPLIVDPIHACIADVLDLPLDAIHAPEIKEFDRRIIADERPVVLAPHKRPFSDVGDPLGVEVRCLSARRAKQLFLDRHFELAERLANRAPPRL
jgi:hypothetical protein